jgi:transposase-like protein
VSRPKRYRRPESFQRVNISQLAREIDRTQSQTRKLVRRAQRLGLLTPRIRSDRRLDLTFDAIEVETIKAMIGVPHRPAPQQQDWLSDYLGEPNARRE